MGHDPGSGLLIQFGGGNASAVFRGTWAWDGTTWTLLTPSEAPLSRTHAGMALDGTNQRLLMFGGTTLGTDFGNDTWEWDGLAGTWIQLNPSNSPAGRIDHCLAPGPGGTIVLFGGTNNTTVFGDTWVWNGATWTRMSPAVRPGPRTGAACAFDDSTQTTVLFGGRSPGGSLATGTWTWNGATWAMKGGIQPPKRFFASMAFDGVTETTLLFGGVAIAPAAAPPQPLGDTWTWDGASWTAEAPPTSPPPRGVAPLARFPADGTLVLFGGQVSGSVYLGDTWVWA